MDLGTGDGRFVSQSARENPDRYYLGIDASPGPLEKLSEKIHRKPDKGGLRNVLFIQAAAENLPRELDGVADEVHVHFPWGSLLGAVTKGDAKVMGEIHRLCAPHALLEVIVGLDPGRDVSELKRLEIPDLTEAFIDSILRKRYADAGFEIREFGRFNAGAWPDICTSWARKLKQADKRILVYWIAQRLTLSD